MPRLARRLSRSRVYHVVIRGNEKKDLFLCGEDKERFIDILKIKRKDAKFSYLAYCLMDNHVHLLLDQGEDDIGKIMQGINVRYAYYFNKRYDRIGHLFQDRFKSEVIEDERYLLAATRYIHNNPVKAGMVSKPADYRWSSYNSYVNPSPETDLMIVNRDMVLSIFAENEEKAITLFKEFSIRDVEERFIDIPDKASAGKISISNEDQARNFINNYLQQQSIAREDLKNAKKLRNALIIHLKKQSNLSVREIASLLEIDRNIVQRIKQ